MHKNARGPPYGGGQPDYPSRFDVPDHLVEWSTPWILGGSVYQPIEFTAPVVFTFDRSIKPNGWADPKSPRDVTPEEWASLTRKSYEGELVFDLQGHPRNPRGRTGIVGRGLLGKWGPNHAADPIVTRYDPSDPKRLQMVAIKRRDTGQWAIPGGMVDAGETVSVTVKREFIEEAGNLQGERKAQFERLADELFAKEVVVYRGYVDDPRNTDHAWIETTAFHFHCNKELGSMLPLESGDDGTLAGPRTPPSLATASLKRPAFDFSCE